MSQVQPFATGSQVFHHYRGLGIFEGVSDEDPSKESCFVRFPEEPESVRVSIALLSQPEESPSSPKAVEGFRPYMSITLEERPRNQWVVRSSRSVATVYGMEKALETAKQFIEDLVNIS